MLTCLGSIHRYACGRVCPLMTSSRRISAPLALWLLLTTTAWADNMVYRTPFGTLTVEVNDPAVKVSLDELELKVSGAGLDEVRLKVGPHLFVQLPGSDEVFSVTREGRVLLRVRSQGRLTAPTYDPSVQPAPVSEADRRRQVRQARLSTVRETAGRLVSLRTELDNIVWKDASARWTTTEAAKLLIGFFRGNGELPGFMGSPQQATELKAKLVAMREVRQTAFTQFSQIANADAAEGGLPILGTWQVTAVEGMGGIAADALEIYDPDPIGRQIAFANESALLTTGGGLWMFDATYVGRDGIDMNVFVRGNTTYRARFRVEGDEATLRVTPMNTPRPAQADGTPTDGGFVLKLRRKPAVTDLHSILREIPLRMSP